MDHFHGATPIGWGWFYLSTILDYYSWHIIAWKLCITMKAVGVTEALELAMQASGCDQATVEHMPRLLSKNGSSCVTADLADYLEDKGMDHVRCAPHYPQTSTTLPADVSHGRGAKIPKMREEIKKQTIRKRRLQHQAAAVQSQTETEPEPPLQNGPRSSKNRNDKQVRMS